MSFNCPNCSKSYEVIPKFCGQCGTQMKICNQCGNPILVDQVFCHHCGAKQIDISQVVSIQNMPQEELINNQNIQPTTIQPTTIQSNTIQPTTIQPTTLQPTVFQSTQVQPTVIQTPTTNKTKKKTGKRIAVITTSIAALLIIVLLVNQVLWPYVQNRFFVNGTQQETTVGSSKKLFGIGKSEEAEGIVNEENTELVSETGVKLIVSPLSVNGDTSAKIKPVKMDSPEKDIDLVMYEFDLGIEDPLEGVVTLEIPYEAKKIPDGFTPEQCIVGLHYNEESQSFEEAHYTVDSTRQVVIIKTDHLSKFGYSLNDNPFNPSTANGTPDLNRNQLFTPDDTWIDAPNYGVYYTMPQDDRFEKAIKYNFEVAKAKSAQQNLDAMMEQISKSGFDAPNQVLFDAGASFLGKMEGVPEHSTTFYMEVFSNNRFEAINKTLSNLGGVVSLFQFASDMYYGKNISTSAFSFLKGMTYWKGAANVAKVFGKAAGSYFSLALVGLFVIELILGPIEEWNKDAYSKLPEHKKIFGAYKTYYETSKENGGGYRSIKDWSDMIDELNNKALTDTTIEDNQRDVYFGTLLKKEIENYVNEFWNLPHDVKVAKVIADKSGNYYGKYALIHFVGNPTDPEISVSSYVDKIYNGEVEGMSVSAGEVYLIKEDAGGLLIIGPGSNESAATKYVAFFDTEGGIYANIKNEMTSAMYNKIITKCIQPLMEYKKEANYINRENELKKSLETVQNELNTVLTLNYIGTTEDEPTPLYPEHIVVPVSDVLKNKGKLSDWAVTLDKEGNGSLDFTMLAHLQSGAFNQVAIYAPADKDKLDTATPVAVINFTIQDIKTDVLINEIKYPTLEELRGVWDSADLTITRLYMSDEFKEMLKGLGEGLKESLEGCEVEGAVTSTGEVDFTAFDKLVGRKFPVVLTILAAGGDSGTFTYEQVVKDEASDISLDKLEIPFTYNKGKMIGSYSEEEGVVTIDIAASYDGKNKVKLEGTVKLNYGNGMLEIDFDMKGSKAYVPSP